MHAGTDFSSEMEEGPGWFLRKHCLRDLAQESFGPPTRPYVPPLRPHFPTSSSKGMNVHIMVTVVLSIPNSQRPCAFCVSYPSPHTVHMSPFLSMHVSPGISTVWVQPLLPTMRLLPGQVRVLCDMPGAQMFHVDVSMEQFLPTALQQETKVAALPAMCFLPMSTGELCRVFLAGPLCCGSQKSPKAPLLKSLPMFPSWLRLCCLLAYKVPIETASPGKLPAIQVLVSGALHQVPSKQKA